MMSLDTGKELTSEDKGKLQKAFESKIQPIKTFHKDLYESGDFYILDINLMNQDTILALYRSGSAYVQMHPTQEGRETPERSTNQWERVIFCQGLSSVLAANNLARWEDSRGPFSYLLYLIVGTYDDPIDRTIKLHLDCSRRVGSKLANPYHDNDNGFHITFYEKVELSSDDKSWKTGHLYEKAGDPECKKQTFRQSAFTMFATSKNLKSAPKSDDQQELDRYWTILLLTPSDFFEKPWKDLSESDLEWKKEVGKHPHKAIAELTCIVHALNLAVDRWAYLHQYIERLLSENFMDPKAYVEFLFDDETFSQSKLYFWVIGCLNEFDISIEDNIKQWTLFREARVTPHIGDSGGTSQNGDSSTTCGMTTESLNQFRALDKKADDIRETLENWRTQFQNQRRTTLALREGLFNASALMESRASTRLGQNVKLLTYVSIFYLPLAFCAALWAIPNMTDSGTRNPFIITAVIVGFITYIIVFNLGNIAELSRRTYHHRRKKLLEAMREDPGWKKRGDKFEEFRPDNDRKTQSEWWIIVYQIWTLVPKMKKSGNSPSDTASV